MQLTLTFTQTRARRTDPDTSKDAAKNAANRKASLERLAIQRAIKEFPPGLTAREVATVTGIEYIECQRRISECAGIERNGDRRDGCAVWVATDHRQIDDGVNYFAAQGERDAKAIKR